jgi:hypothetical protein
MSNTWTPPFRQGSTDSSVLAAVSTPPPDASGTVQGNESTAWFSPTTLPTGPSALGAADPFQQLSSDIPALLVQAQGGTATRAASTAGTASTASTSAASGAVGGNAIGATAAADPEQQLATDLQSLLAQFQSTDAGSGQNGQTAGTGQVQPHHHHHHQGGGHEATTAASGIGGATTASPTTASSAATSSGTAASGSDQMLSNTLAADIMQALQAYGSTTPAAIGPALTA